MDAQGQPARDVVALEAHGDPALAGVWRRLAVLRENPFLTPEWYESWCQSHPGQEPHLLVWRRDGAVRGVLPLVRDGVGPLRLLRFAGARRADWLGPVCSVEDEIEMAAACGSKLLGESSSGHLLLLPRVAVDCEWPRALTDSTTRIGMPVRGREDVLPYIRFGEGGFDEYLSGRSRNFRSQLGRRRRKLEREHGLVFRMTTDPDGLASDLETFFALHAERWAERGGSSALSADARRLHRAFAEAALDRRWLRLWIAEADGIPAAAWYGWRIGGRYCYALSGLSSRFQAHGLGTVMLGHTIERAAAEGAEVYDLMWGDEGYKRRFETGRRQVRSWTVGRRGHPAVLAASAMARMVAAGLCVLPEEARAGIRRIRDAVRR